MQMAKPNCFALPTLVLACLPLRSRFGEARREDVIRVLSWADYCSLLLITRLTKYTNQSCSILTRLYSAS